jgi:hypothetical protein
MFYMLARVHHQMGAGEELSTPQHFCSVLLDLLYKMQKATTSF